MVLEKSIDENKICNLRLNRPDKRNALNLALINELIAEIQSIMTDPSIRGVIITGNGPAFCAGGDITEMTHRYGKALVTKNRLDDGINKIVRLIRQLRRPVLALVNGSCYGAGLVLATACDVIYANPDAKFGFAHGNMGLIPEGSYFLSRFIGLHKVKELVFSRAAIDSKEAFELGLITRVIEDDLFEYGYATMKKWCDGPVETFGLAKEVLNRGYETKLSEHIFYESMAQGTAFTGKEHKEGVDAFLNKRKSDFTNLED